MRIFKIKNKIIVLKPTNAQNYIRVTTISLGAFVGSNYGN
jgi:hypothetical protein